VWLEAQRSLEEYALLDADSAEWVEAKIADL